MRNIADLIAAMKARPSTISFASPTAAPPHGVELFAAAAGIDLMHVPYKGGAQAFNGVASGQVPAVAMNASRSSPGRRRSAEGAGRARPRSPIFPDAPTIAESGGLQGLRVFGLVHGDGAAKTPMPIVEAPRRNPGR